MTPRVAGAIRFGGDGNPTQRPEPSDTVSGCGGRARRGTPDLRKKYVLIWSRHSTAQRSCSSSSSAHPGVHAPGRPGRRARCHRRRISHHPSAPGEVGVVDVLDDGRAAVQHVRVRHVVEEQQQLVGAALERLVDLRPRLAGTGR